MPEQTLTKLQFVQQRIQQIRTLLLQNNGIQSVSQDGMSVSFERAGLISELDDLERQEQDLLNPGHRFMNIDLRGVF